MVDREVRRVNNQQGFQTITSVIVQSSNKYFTVSIFVTAHVGDVIVVRVRISRVVISIRCIYMARS